MPSFIRILFLLFPLCLSAQRDHPYGWLLSNEVKLLKEAKVKEIRTLEFQGDSKEAMVERIYTFKKPGILKSVLFIQIAEEERDSTWAGINKAGVLESFKNYGIEDGQKVERSAFYFFYDKKGRFSRIEHEYEGKEKKVVLTHYWGETGG